MSEVAATRLSARHFVAGLLGLVGASLVQGLLHRYAGNLAALFGGGELTWRVISRVVGVTLFLPAMLVFIRTLGEPPRRRSGSSLFFLWMVMLGISFASAWLFDSL